MYMEPIIMEEFVVDKQWNIKDLILSLEDSMSIPDVIVNGQRVNRESDSYLSFLLDLSKELVVGENQLKIVKN